MSKKLVDLGGSGWDSEPFDIYECEFVSYDRFEINYDDNVVEFTNAKEAYKFYKSIKATKSMWGFMKSGYSDMLEHHAYV
jgi:hypothetical protein